MVLIPATSVKGAIAHRTAFYYNKINGWFAGDSNAKTGSDNHAVATLFGSIDGTKATRGNVIISDEFASETFEDKIFDHVAIDRFTGGAIDGALFNEKATNAKGYPFSITILVDNNALQEDAIKIAFENALRDICKGILPLGGAVNKGYGMFHGTLTCNNKSLTLEEEKQ